MAGEAYAETSATTLTRLPDVRRGSRLCNNNDVPAQQGQEVDRTLGRESEKLSAQQRASPASRSATGTATAAGLPRGSNADNAPNKDLCQRSLFLTAGMSSIPTYSFDWPDPHDQRARPTELL